MKIIQSEHTITTNLYSVSALLYFVSIALITQTTSQVASILFYCAMMMCVALQIRAHDRIPPIIWVASFIAAALGVLNILFVGNLSWLKLFILLMSFYVAVFFMDERVSPDAFKYALYLNIAIVLFRMICFGFSSKVYVESSNNYVSIYIIVPAVLYYIKCEGENCKVTLLPMIIAWILSFFAGGRAGLICCTILLAGLVIKYYFGEKFAKREKLVLITVVALAIVVLGILSVPLLEKYFSDFRVVQRFFEMGITSNSRLVGWGEYMDSLSNPKYFLLGSDIKNLKWATRFDGNIHNSFLFVHAYFGIIAVGFMVFFIINAFIFGFKNKRTVFLLCLLVFLVRAMTDHMFGANRLSAAFLALIMYPAVYDWRVRTGSNQ